jgi:hypothetical protein
MHRHKTTFREQARTPAHPAAAVLSERGHAESAQGRQVLRINEQLDTAGPGLV